MEYFAVNKRTAYLSLGALSPAIGHRTGYSHFKDLTGGSEFKWLFKKNLNGLIMVT